MEEFDVHTPEAVTISYRIAGIGGRFLAVAIDYVLLVALLIIAVIGALVLSLLPAGWGSAALIIGATAEFVIFFGYFVIFETLWSGRTPGKRLMKIRVLKTSGYPIGFVDALLRNLVRLIDFLPVLYGVGVVAMFISPESRRLGDYVAGTVVVHDRPAKLEELTLAAPDTARIPVAGVIDPDEFAWKLERLSANDLHVIDEFLRRAPTLAEKPRYAIAGEIAGPVATRIEARRPLEVVRFLQRVMELRNLQQAESEKRS